MLTGLAIIQSDRNSRSGVARDRWPELRSNTWFQYEKIDQKTSWSKVAIEMQAAKEIMQSLEIVEVGNVKSEPD